MKDAIKKMESMMTPEQIKRSNEIYQEELVKDKVRVWWERGNAEAEKYVKESVEPMELSGCHVKHGCYKVEKV